MSIGSLEAEPPSVAPDEPDEIEAEAPPLQPEKKEAPPYERHRAVNESLTGSATIDGVLERRADGLEKIIHGTPAETPLLKSSLEMVQRRVSDDRSLTDRDRLPLPEKYQTQEINERVGTMAEKLLTGDDQVVSLASLMVETAGGANAEQRDTVKALGLRMLQMYAPESSEESWRSEQFGEGRRQRVRVGEMLVVAGQLGDLSSEMRESPHGQVEAAKARSYYDRFTQYAHNHDVPPSFRQHLVDMTAVLERQHPSLLKVVKDKKVQPLGEKERVYIRERSRPAQAKLGEVYEERRQQREIEDIPLSAIVAEETEDEKFDAAINEGTQKAERKDLEAEAAARPVQEAEERGLIVEAGDVVDMGRPELEQRLKGWTEDRATSPERQQASAWLEEWRAQEGDLGASTLRPVFDRYTAPNSEREEKRQRYLDIMQNELGYLDALREGGVLNKLTSQWTEALYARVAINPTKPWRWFSRRGREDVMQARGDAIASLRAGMRDPKGGLDEPQRALFLELAERYEELQVRDGLKGRPVRTFVGGVVERRLGGQKINAMVEKRVARGERQVQRAKARERHEFESATTAKEQELLVGKELQRANRPWWKRWFGG